MPTLITKNNLSDTAIASIAAGFASRSDVSIDDILTLVERLMAITPEAGTRSAPQSKAIPATPAAQTMTQDTIFCLCCGKGFKMLKRHLGAEHGLTEENTASCLICLPIRRWLHQAIASARLNTPRVPGWESTPGTSSAKAQRSLNPVV